MKNNLKAFIAWLSLPLVGASLAGTRLGAADVVLDPGHGGSTAVGGSSPNNAVGPTGTKEKDWCLLVATKAAQVLAAAPYSHRVTLTRTGDTNLSLTDRAKKAKDIKAPVFVSIHFNGDANPQVKGTETWVHATASADSKLLAASVQQRVQPATGHNDRGIKSSATLDVLKPALHDLATAACLVEVSFLTQAAEESRLKTNAYIDKLGKAIAVAVDDFIKKQTSGSVDVVAGNYKGPQ